LKLFPLTLFLLMLINVSIKTKYALLSFIKKGFFYNLIDNKTSGKIGESILKIQQLFK